MFRGKEAVLLDNTEQIYFGVTSLESADRVSKMLGPYTRPVESHTENESRSWQQDSLGQPGVNVSRSAGVSVAVQSRELLQPAEVLRLHPDLMIAFLKGVPPILCRAAVKASEVASDRRRWDRLEIVAWTPSPVSA